MESQSSLLPGFLASLSNLVHDLRKDLKPKFARSLNIHFPYKNVFSVDLALIPNYDLKKSLFGCVELVFVAGLGFKSFQWKRYGAFVFVDDS